MKTSTARGTNPARHTQDMARVVLCAFVTGVLGMHVQAASANGYGENQSWQFRTSADKANNAAIEDMILRKKGGYYGAFSTTYNTYNTTNIGTQTNCNLTATAAGNSGTNSMTGSASSPVVSNSGSTSSSATGNSNANTSTGSTGRGQPGIDTSQANDGSVGSGVYGSSTNVGSGAINAAGGTNYQSLNSEQGNSGNQTASVSGSSACSFAHVGHALN